MEDTRELDAWIAERVMGWTRSADGYWQDPNYPLPEMLPPAFHSTAFADYQVLVKVREEWDEKLSLAFVRHCSAIWVDREPECGTQGWPCYEIGDYSRAARAALEST